MINIKKRPAKPIKDKEILLDIQDYLKSKSIRNYVLFVLGIGTGYRTGDLVQLRVRDVKRALRAGYFLIMESKKLNSHNIRQENMKPREVTIPNRLAIILKDYIKYKNDYDYMFKSRKGIGPIKVKQVSRILSEAGEYFGLENITAHSMRKTYAYIIYVNSGHDIVAVKEMLGHSSIEITKRYLGLDRELYDKYSETLNYFIR